MAHLNKEVPRTIPHLVFFLQAATKTTKNWFKGQLRTAMYLATGIYGVRMFSWQPRNNMAAPVPLLPLDSSLPSSVLSSGGEEVSSARQRRRKTTKKPGIEKLARSALTLGGGGLELDTFKSHHQSGSPRNLPNVSPAGGQERKTNDVPNGRVIDEVASGKRKEELT